MNKTDNIIWLKCTEYSEGNGVVKDKEEVLNIMVGQVNLNWDWEMRRIQSCEDYPERGFGVFLVMRAVCAKTLGQDRIYYIWGTERKCVQIEPRSQEIQLERFWGSRSGKPWIYRKEFGVYIRAMENSWGVLSWRVIWLDIHFLKDHSWLLGGEWIVTVRVEEGRPVRNLMHLFWWEMIVPWAKESELMFMAL